MSDNVCSGFLVSLVMLETNLCDSHLKHAHLPLIDKVLHFQMTSRPGTNPNPSHRASAVSRFFLSWVSILLRKSHTQKTLELSDLYDLLPHLESTALTERLEANWLDEVRQRHRPPSLVRATIRTLGWSPFLVGLLIIPCVCRSFTHERSHSMSLRRMPLDSVKPFF